ncbi:MAG: phosphoribosyl-AMP cyclohydrolase [Clostridiaceae bacterium]|nr:phosphoribosyl-AMP cyclohydrolase [Clostridiaceae bacterium]
MDNESFIKAVKYNEKGLVPVITQDNQTGEVLMLAWMNEDALKLTLERKRMVYFSRSRQELWQKGDTSGHFQNLVSISIDCDGDTLLAKVIQEGAACHTGNRTCFFRNLDL